MTTKRYMKKIVEQVGLKPGTDLEDVVAYRLYRAGLVFEQQYKIGNFRVDFAFPEISIAVEADGWWHRSPEGAAKDAERDSWLRSEGWLVLRVDDRFGEDSLERQIARVGQLIHRMEPR